MTNTRYFVVLDHKDWVRVEKLLEGYPDINPTNALRVRAIIKTGRHTETNPLRDDQCATCILWDGNVVLEEPL